MTNVSFFKKVPNNLSEYSCIILDTFQKIPHREDIVRYFSETNLSTYSLILDIGIK